MKASRAWVAIIVATVALGGAVRVMAEENEEAKKVVEAKAVLSELLTAADRGVPKELLENAKCIAVIPGVMKAAMGVGARRGKGVMICRHAGTWSPPSFITLTGGSFGLQLGVEKTDVVLFFMSEKGARSLASSKFTLGAKAGVAAGPLGRSGEAATDLKLNAEIYSYAKSKGLFAGVSLEGARLAPDNKDNAAYYGKPVTAKALMFGGANVTEPAEAKDFISTIP